MHGMGWDVFGTMAVGLGAAAVIYAASHAARAMGRPLPRWLLPVGIGLSALCFTIWNEYTWFPRVTAQLPPGVHVLETGTGGKAWRPWAFVVPMVTRFTVLDARDVQTVQVDDVAERRAPVLLIERWQPTQIVQMGFDCIGGRQRGITAAGEATPWHPAPQGDRAQVLICGG